MKHSKRESGMVLVMTIFVLSVLTLLVVGFLSSMLLERNASHAYENTQRAKLVAQGAVSHAIDILRTNIPDPARIAEGPATAAGQNWVVNPGRLTVIDSASSPVFIPLHTGEVTEAPDPAAPRDALSVDLNSPLPGQTTPAIVPAAPGSPTAPVMRVLWSNLLQDPSQPASADNPLTGRYAFWMDDECAKINFNTAVGKPAITAVNRYTAQLNSGIVTPIFALGSADSTYGTGAGGRSYSLGTPQSVNLDVLLQNPGQLLRDKLLDQVFLHGYARYPQAILNFIKLPAAQKPQDWYEQNKFNLTFHSRSPEFNAFGKSRFFTTRIPLSLEGGPSYQHPFIYDPSGKYDGNASEVLNLNSLFGNFGFTSSTVDADGDTVDGGNAINQAQLNMLMAYLGRRWPGYTRSFIEKYGRDECRQIALNILLMARLATSDIDASSLAAFSKAWSYRSTSVNYSPKTGELAGYTPERFYWRFPSADGTSTKLMLPQSAGPFVTEVRLFAKPVVASPAPKNNPALLNGLVAPSYIQYYYEVEYYMPPIGPVVDLGEFPVKVDYLDVKAVGAGKTMTQQFGPTDGNDTRAARNWNQATNLGRLQVFPPAGLTLGPNGSKLAGAAVPNRQLVRSPVYYVGQRATVVPLQNGGDYSDWDPLPFESKTAGTVSVDIRFRPGLGVKSAPGRPVQMIPLGLTNLDTLKAHFDVNLATGGEQVYSWQINDPRLSGDLAQWENATSKSGPGDVAAIGTPGAVNANEPAENAPQKSKFRYLQRAPDDAQLGGYDINRGDEYQTTKRIASPGYWSLLHTGMQSGQPWRTIDLRAEAGQTSPPDWLLLDLFGGTYPMAHDQWKINATLPDQFSVSSYMNSSAGQVNLNSRIYPDSPYFQVPARTLPLTAVFKNLAPDTAVASVVAGIQTYQSGGKFFRYPGELANVPAAALNGATQWEQESLLRNMAGCLTTQSNTFGVWGVAQVVKKLPRNQQHGAFEKGDLVRGEKRFYALVERYVWAGRDGIPGNAHAGSNAVWDRLAKQTANITLAGGMTNTLFQLPGSPPLLRSTTIGAGGVLDLDASGSFAEFDGPEAVGANPFTQAALGKVVHQASSLENAYNPPQAVIKYRVVYFKYLDE